MTTWILGILFCASVVEVTIGQTCSRSHDCASGHCCRNLQTQQNMVDDPQGPFESLLGVGHGQCVDGGARAGDMCDDSCQCPSGYECYRQVTGACCAPRTCITVAEANSDRDRWRCQPPPPAPFAAGVEVRRRSSLFDALCPQAGLAGVPQMPGGIVAG